MTCVIRSILLFFAVLVGFSGEIYLSVDALMHPLDFELVSFEIHPQNYTFQFNMQHEIY